MLQCGIGGLQVVTRELWQFGAGCLGRVGGGAHTFGVWYLGCPVLLTVLTVRLLIMCVEVQGRATKEFSRWERMYFLTSTNKEYSKAPKSLE